MSEPIPAGEIVKGSWEALLLQAAALAGQDNPDAGPRFQKLVDRLSRLPKAQRLAAGGRLNGLLFSATLQYVEFLNIAGRYDDAIAVIAQTVPAAPEDDRFAWQRFAISIQVMAGRVDEGLKALREIIDSASEDELPASWAGFAFAALQQGAPEATQAAVAHLDSWYNQRWGQEQTAPEARVAASNIAYAKARIAADLGQGAEALAWYEHAMMLNEDYRENPGSMYPYLVDAGAYKEALTLVRRDQSDAVQAGFWHGLIQRRLGNYREAERLWRQVVETELDDEVPVSLLEWTMAHYYLGDKHGAALAGVLESIRGRATHDSGLFYLAGVGWAQRGDRVAAIADFRQAVRRRRALAEGTALPHRWWHLVADLTEEPMQAALREFFEPAPSDRLDRSDR